ncbi:MAG: hypothetical protein JY451_06385 [Erythrobacter sp.]|nr:MAG: hypothetical protein JY451_06385 [Erythrobacter sp.]
MKVHIEIDCTPEEARQFMGLPNVEQANAIYVDTIAKAMQGVSNTEQLEQYAQQLAPMGQMGLKMFQSFVEGASRNMTGGAAPSEKTGDAD